MLRNYLKIAFKVLLRRRFFTFVSLFGIGLTLVVLTVAVALIDHVFSDAPPESSRHRTLGIYLMGMHGPHASRTSFAGYGFLDRYIRDLPGAEEISFLTVPSQVVTYRDGRRVEAFLKRTDGAFWRILDFELLEGRPLLDEDEEQAHRVAVINRSTRQRLFGEGDALGETVELDGERFRVVGVVADVPILRLVPFADIWVPISTSPSRAFEREFVGQFMALIQAESPAAFPDLKAEVRRRIDEAQLPDPETFDTLTGEAETFLEAVSRFFAPSGSPANTGRLRAIVLVLAVLFMLLPTLNLVNLNLSRILERSSEIGVRKAFGGSSATLVGQFVVENLILTALGGALGLAASAVVLALINASGAIPYAQLALNGRIFGYGLAMTLLFGLLSGVYPALKMSRLHPVTALQGRSVHG